MEMNYDESTLHQLEEELHVHIYPGTEIMTDVGSHHFVKSLDKSHKVLVPQPSANRCDPLNWSPRWKLAAMSTTTLTTFAQGFGPLALAPMFPQLIEAFDSDLAGVVRFTGICILVLGFSNFLWLVLPYLRFPKHNTYRLLQGPHSDILRSSTRLDLLHSDMLGIQYMASCCPGLSKFYGCLHFEWNWCGTS